MSDPVILHQPAFILAHQVYGEELDIARSAWVSTYGERAEDEADMERVKGLINYLMRERHGSPFEQVDIRFLTKAPIVVWREHMRHRIASYNEKSGRYSKMDPEFYVVPPERPLQQTGKVGAYRFELGTGEQYRSTYLVQDSAAHWGWRNYEALLEKGVAKEVARMHMPLTLYSTAYVKMNLRGLMNFLSLRAAETALWEIQYLAALMEDVFAQNFPLTYLAWVDNGRVAP